MKIFYALIGFGLVMSVAQAAPVYVGKHVSPQDNISLGFTGMPLTGDDQEIAGPAGDDTTIGAIELKGDYNVMENLAVGASLPFYFTSSDAFQSTDSENAIGNISVSANWTQEMSTSTDDFQWGYAAGLDTYLPTSREDEALAVAFANPSTDLYKYHTRAFSIHPRGSLFIDADRFYGQTTVGYGFMTISKDDGFATLKNNTDTSRNSLSWQTALTWKAMPNLNANLEYNTVILDSATRTTTEKDDQYRHAISPSVSGNYNQMTGQIFANLPLDSATRKNQNVAFGANVGYRF